MKKITLVIFLTFFVLVVRSQPGIAELKQVRGELSRDFFAMSDLSYVLAALVAIIGSIHIYHKWQMGQDVSTDLPAWFFAALFIIIINIALVQVFGL
ncbi:hypothetical protein ACVWYG_003747 [Pedobacter sp. UYEF25]